MVDLLKNRKKELELQLEYLDIIKYSKLLYLLNTEINNLLCFYTKKQVNQMINEIFSLSISASYFYAYCSKNLQEKKKIKEKLLEQDCDIKSQKESVVSNDIKDIPSLEELIGK